MSARCAAAGVSGKKRERDLLRRTGCDEICGLGHLQGESLIAETQLTASDCHALYANIGDLE